MESNFGTFLMAVLVDGINPFCIKTGRAPNDSVDLISLRKKKFSKIRTVLSSDASDQCAHIGVKPQHGK
jgi:hypothetical protein